MEIANTVGIGGSAGPDILRVEPGVLITVFSDDHLQIVCRTVSRLSEGTQPLNDCNCAVTIFPMVARQLGRDAPMRLRSMSAAPVSASAQATAGDTIRNAERFLSILLIAILAVTLGGHVPPVWAATATVEAALDASLIEPISLFGIPLEFVLFGLTLLGVALFHHRTLQVALTGLAAITLYKLVFTGFKFGQGLAGLGLHMQHEWVILANLFLLLMGFALLSRHFEKSQIPEEMPAFLPDDWKGGFALLVMVFVLSAFLDNIAAALIGGTMARHVFRGKVHIGYLAAVVAASNAGGSGSVVGDTTTTMMWIDGISPITVFEAYVAAIVALVIFGIPASRQQQRHSPITKDAPGDSPSTGRACSSWSQSWLQPFLPM